MVTSDVTRRNFIGAFTLSAAYSAFGSDGLARTGARPTKNQLVWADQEIGMFYHFDITVFTPGWKFRTFKDFPDPKLYNPVNLNTDRWMEAAKAIGAKYVVFVAKHCSGFLQWQSQKC